MSWPGSLPQPAPQTAAGQPPEGGQPIGWRVLDPDGSVVGAGAQTVTEASAGAGQEQ